VVVGPPVELLAEPVEPIVIVADAGPPEVGATVGSVPAVGVVAVLSVSPVLSDTPVEQASSGRSATRRGGRRVSESMIRR